MEMWEMMLQEQCARRKTVAAGVRWTVYPAAIIYFFFGNLRQILAVHGEVGTAEHIQPSMCQYHGSRGIHYARESRRPCRSFFTRAGDVRSNTVNGWGVRPVDPLNV
jgi:hypothetical protein